ncbi:MAG: penicillin acylase family protein [Gemmatimonadales bacterium]
MPNVMPAVLAALSLATLWSPAAAQDYQAEAAKRLTLLDGAVELPGLDSTVEVRRDRWGVPHIYAKTSNDLFFAQGYVAASDRLWQMEMWRRQGEGLLSEVLGPEFVERDRFARLLQYRGDMSAEWTSYAPDTRAIVRAFVAGVNAYVAEVKGRPPIEFTMLGFEPALWADEVPLQRMAALSMTGNALREITRAAQVAALGADRVRRYYPIDPDRALDPVADLDLTGIGLPSLGAAAPSYGAVPYKRLEGSNNWVVAGRHTASGKPLLANDPHRTIAVPSLRYLTHLVGPGWNVIGAGEPGVPGVAGGHNERIAFGFTIVGMDQQDVYVERLGPCPASAGQARCYWHNDRWEPVRTVIDTIPVKGERPRIVALEFTHHGPIVSIDSARGRGFAIRFVGSEPGTAGYLAQISINRATDWASFLQAAYRWKLPTENLVYADVDGNIGWIAAGLNPIRSWTGLLPVPGDGRFEWEGFQPFSKLPQLMNPPSGVIATANHNILPEGYREQLNYEWATPYRYDRVMRVLSGRSGWTVKDFERLQHDEYSIPAEELTPMLVTALRRRSVAHPAVDTLAAWDYVMRRDAVAPTVFAAWLRQVGPLVYDRLVEERPGGRGRRDWDLPTVIRLLTRTPEQLGASPIAARDSIAVSAFRAAVAELADTLGATPGGWRWGRLHTTPFRHPLAAMFDLEAPARGGDENTVNMTGGAGWMQTAGGSYRGIFDTSNWDNSVATSVPGQSGQPGSQYYGNLLPLWAEGRYFPLAFSREAVERETAHVLLLKPR